MIRITNEQAIEILKDLWRYEHSEFSEKEIREALEKGIKALENQKTIIDELEKIREEIKTHRDEWIKGQDAEWHTYDRCLVIIENHISELKGE